MRLVKRSKASLGVNHSFTLRTSHLYGLTLLRLSKLEEAEEVLMGVVKWNEEVYGPRHRYFLRSKYNLVLSLQGLKKYKEAMRVLK